MVATVSLNRNAWILLPLLPLAGISVSAAEETRPAFQANVTLSTDYIFRGYSRSDADPVFQAGLSYRHRVGFFAGLWGSTVEFAADEGAGDERQVELRALAGFGRTIGQSWSWNLSVVHSEFPDAVPLLDTSYTEASASAQFRDLFAITIAYTGDYLGSDIPTFFIEVSGSYPLPGNFNLSAGVGQAELDLHHLDYVYGHLAAGWTLGRFSLDLGYYESDGRSIPSWGEVADGTLVFSISARFP